MTSRSDHLRGYLLMILAVLVLTPDSLLISLIEADHWTVVFWRGLLSAFTLTVALAVMHGREAIKKTWQVGLPGVFAGLLFGCSTISFVISVRLTTAANTLVIVASMPLFAAVFTRIFLKEKVPLRTWLAALVGFGGIAILFSGSLGGGALIGDLLAMVTACFMAGIFVLIRRFEKINMIPSVVFSGILTSMLVGYFSNPVVFSRIDFLYLILMGTIVLPVPLAAMTVAPKLIPAPEASLILLLETFLGPLWVWMVLKEKPAMETVLGGLLLVITLIVHSLWSMREAQTDLNSGR
ncbi:DMT family transporter [bacterium]|nr:MAG: DMT family transporter [bacterium]